MACAFGQNLNSRYGVVVARGPYPCPPLSPNCRVHLSGIRPVLLGPEVTKSNDPWGRQPIDLVSVGSVTHAAHNFTPSRRAKQRGV